jgi:hypothetical protein
MNGRRAVIGLSLLCALLFSAFAVPSAFAAKGTTAFTCVKEGKEFRGEHCLSTGTAALEFFHKAIAVGTKTETEGTNEKTANTTGSATEPLLTLSLAGSQWEITCETEAATGTITNELVEKVMRVKGEKIVIKYTNCVVKGVLAELGCELEGGAVTTNELTSVTENEKMTVLFEPTTTTAFATLTFKKCSKEELNKAFEVTGTARAIPEGATLRTSNLTTTALKFGGAAASLISNTTVRMKGKENPITLTTTEPE